MPLQVFDMFFFYQGSAEENASLNYRGIPTMLTRQKFIVIKSKLPPKIWVKYNLHEKNKWVISSSSPLVNFS